MLFDILLVSVIVWTAYLGPVILRRFGAGQRAYGYMILGDLALAVIALAARHSDSSRAIANLIGTVAIGGGVCLVLVPPILRDLSRRALVADWMRVARFLVDLRELLQPGMGARQERELIDTILAVRSGNVDDAVDILRDRRSELSEPRDRRNIDERIAMTYLYARRWQDAVEHFESAFADEPAGASPQLIVEMIRAYCELGDLETAAELVQLIESASLAEEPMLAFLANRARLVFLAFVGRTTAVESIVAPGGPLGAMPPSARCFWSGVARLNAGDRPGARASLSEAARLSGRDGRARQIAETILSSVDEPGVAGPHAIGPFVAELADRLTELATTAKPRPKAKQPVRLSGVRWRRVPVTVSLLVANLAVAAALYVFADSAGDLGTLARAGANVKSATVAGDWWRLVTSMFLHVGLAHLLLNMYGLWVLGRLVEQFHGSTRFFAIYMVAGITGAIASVVFGGPATSMGASGAVFGLLGAAIAELALFRKRYPKQWSGLLLGNLLFLTVANVVIGFVYPIIDQSAHIGGLVAGAVVAALLSTQLEIGMSRPIRAVAGVLALCGALALAYALWGVATTSYGETLARYGLVERDVGGIKVQVPEPWRSTSGRRLYDPSIALMMSLERVDPASDVALDTAVEELLRAEHYGGARRAGFDSALDAETPLMRLPGPWESRELIVRASGIGGEQRFRALVFARETEGGELWLGTLYYPEALADDIAPVFERVLATAH